MKNTTRLFRLGLVLAGTLTLVAAAETAKQTVNELAWLTGRWEVEQKGVIVREEWMPPAGGIMLEMSRIVKDGKAIQAEFAMIRTDEQGDIFYVSDLAGPTKTPYKLVKLEGQSVVFEDKQPDFTQRIYYTLQPDGTLLAAIERTGKDGKPARAELPYKPAK